MEYINSYFYYIFTFSFSIISSWIYSKKAKFRLGKAEKFIYALLITVPVIILQGFRYKVGTDYMSYASLSQGFAESNQTYVSWYIMEPLFLILSRFSYSISGGNPYFFFLVEAIIENIILFKIADYYKNEIDLPVLYTLYYGLCFPYFLNAERQGLAVLIIWYSLRYVDEGKFIKFLICLVTATLIHNTAIVCIVFYLFDALQRSSIKKRLKKIILVIMAFSPLFMNIFVDVLGRIQFFNKYMRYLNDGSTDTANLNFIFSFAMGLILALGCFNQLKNIREFSRWVFLYELQMFSFLLTGYMAWAFRMAYYFYFGLMFAYAAVEKMLKKPFNKVIFFGITLAFSLFHFTYKFYIQGNCDIFPYQFVWNR